jgi:hypothetical protein
MMVMGGISLQYLRNFAFMGSNEYHKYFLQPILSFGCHTNQKLEQAHPIVQLLLVCKTQKVLLLQNKKILRMEQSALMFSTRFVVEVIVGPFVFYSVHDPRLV